MGDFVKQVPRRVPGRDLGTDLDPALGIAAGLMISVAFWLVIGFGLASTSLDPHGGVRNLAGAAEATMRDEQQVANRHQAHAGRRSSTEPLVAEQQSDTRLAQFEGPRGQRGRPTRQ
jgi:hypothetical protein